VDPQRSEAGSAVENATKTAALDMEKIDFSPYDKLIFHTADPIYLSAFSRTLRRFRGICYIGFTLPPSFWLWKTIWRRMASVAEDLAIRSLKRKTTVVLYSETGAIRFDQRSLRCHLKLGPVQSIRSGGLSASEQTLDMSKRVKIGFFGAPLDDKGFQILLQLADNAEVRSRFHINVFLPPGQQELVEKINAGNGAIRANSENRDLSVYFGCMSSVDLVYALYSPVAYQDRMSGIVQDSIFGREALTGNKYLYRHAPVHRSGGSGCLHSFGLFCRWRGEKSRSSHRRAEPSIA
jgi:hypothetical protein